MSKVLITGSADGLGREAANQLVRGGHEAVLHARDEPRAQQALAGVLGAASALPGDLSSITSTRALADLVNAAGVFDAIIHNAGIGYREDTRRWDGYQAYSDSKLFDAVLAAAIARRWPDVVSSSVDPGWVSTRMGGPGAPGAIGPGAETQVWLATSNDPLALQSGRHFYHLTLRETHPAVADPVVQDGLLLACYELTGQAIKPPTPHGSHEAS